MSQTNSVFENRFVPFLYDCLIAGMFLPFGGIRELRKKTIRAFLRGPGSKILEPGCGTGSMTKLLYNSGCSVTAFDGSEQMLKRAKKKAPEAVFLRSSFEEFETKETFDFVVFSFVLHELDPDLIIHVLENSKRYLRPGGKVVILDHAVPESGVLSRLWKWFLLKLEPPSVRICIENGYGSLLKNLGFHVSDFQVLAGGTASYWIAESVGYQ
ncbi:class I SAM-dependent methyltransferase [Leptospira sp. WS92.C1]